MITNFGDIAEDKVVSSTGSYSATAPKSSQPLGHADGDLPGQRARFIQSGANGDRDVARVGDGWGGTAVTVTGTGFLAGATVTFGGTAATNVTVVNSTTITATTPAHTAGAVNVVVTNTDGQSGTLKLGLYLHRVDEAERLAFVQVNYKTSVRRVRRWRWRIRQHRQRGT